MLWYQAEPRTEVATFCKGCAVADCRHDSACRKWSDARDSLQPLAVFVLTGELYDFSGHVVDSGVETVPVLHEILDEMHDPGRQDIAALSQNGGQCLPQRAVAGSTQCT